MKPETLKVFGEIASKLRYLVGGEDINGFPVNAATVEHAGKLITDLRNLLDKYDLMIIEEMENK